MRLLDPDDDLLAGLGLYPLEPDDSGVGMQPILSSFPYLQPQLMPASPGS
jgi:hypothetical protein